MEKQIASWAYTKGETVKDWLDGLNLAIALIVGFATAFILGFLYRAKQNNALAYKFNSWLFFAIVIIVGITVYFICKASSSLIYGLYKLFFTVDTVECSITNNKIIIGNKINIINDDTKILNSVKLLNVDKQPILTFIGIEKKANKSDTTFTYNIIVPTEMLYKAEQVVNYFKNIDIHKIK